MEYDNSIGASNHVKITDNHSSTFPVSRSNILIYPQSYYYRKFTWADSYDQANDACTIASSLDVLLLRRVHRFSPDPARLEQSINISLRDTIHISKTY